MVIEPKMPSQRPQVRFLDDVSAQGFAASMLGVRRGCSDQVIGDILSGWRYDLSTLDPSVRGDYEQHFAECPHCRARSRLHRTVDIVLMGVFTISVFAFLLATALLRHEPWGQMPFAYVHARHLTFALSLQSAAIGGLLFSVLAWILVAVATPAPYLISSTVQQRRLAHSRNRA